MNKKENTHPLHDILTLLDAKRPPLAADLLLRDLAWLLFAPDTLRPDLPDLAGHAWPRSWCEARYPDWQERLLQLARQPQPLLEAMKDPPRRLGLYAEALMAWWMRDDVVLRHHVVREGKRTVGDFDLLLNNGDGGLIHMELAVKFFLGLPGASTMDHWVGTTLDDSLGIKWRHVIEHQLQLSSHPAAQGLLPAPVRQRWCWFKAWLFHPLEQSIATSDLLLPGHSRGYWGHAQSLLRHWGADAQTFPLPLLRRLAPARFGATERPRPLSDWIAAWLEEPYPRLFARVRASDHGWEETERAYLMPDDWLRRATAAGLCP